MPRQSIFDMPFSRVYPLLVQKAERKGRTKQEVDAILFWLTGHDALSLQDCLDREIPCREFYGNSPCWNPKSALVSGSICGAQIEQIEDPLMKRIRILDKLIDELAKGKPMEKILRK